MTTLHQFEEVLVRVLRLQEFKRVSTCSPWILNHTIVRTVLKKQPSHYTEQIIQEKFPKYKIKNV